MGFSITWFAVREEHAEDFLGRLGLAPTGRREEVPEALISSIALDTGWRVLWYNEYGCPFLEPTQLAALSNLHDILMCLVEEHVMASSSELWSQGRRKWWIAHEGEEGPKGLDTEGELPGCFAAIRQEMEQTQAAEGGMDAGVDYIFEIPLRVAQALVGFKHDEGWPQASNEGFVVLSEPAGKKGFFGKLFSR